MHYFIDPKPLPAIHVIEYAVVLSDDDRRQFFTAVDSIDRLESNADFGNSMKEVLGKDFDPNQLIKKRLNEFFEKTIPEQQQAILKGLDLDQQNLDRAIKPYKDKVIKIIDNLKNQGRNIIPLKGSVFLPNSYKDFVSLKDENYINRHEHFAIATHRHSSNGEIMTPHFFENLKAIGEAKPDFKIYKVSAYLYGKALPLDTKETLYINIDSFRIGGIVSFDISTVVDDSSINPAVIYKNNPDTPMMGTPIPPLSPPYNLKL